MLLSNSLWGAAKAGSYPNVRMPPLRWLIVLLREWRRRRRDRNVLAAMSDRALRDIGLTRYDMEVEVRKPFWQP